MAFEIHPFDSFMKSPTMSQRDTDSVKVMAVFIQVAHSIGKRRETRLALNFLSDAQAIGDELVVFRIHPFDSFTKSPRMPQTDTKCLSYGRFQPGGSFNREKKGDMTCTELCKRRASYWSWTCGFSDSSFR